MTRREKSLATLKKLGFKVAGSLPTKRENEKLRPALQIVERFLALQALFLWVAGSEDMKRIDVKRSLTPEERAIYALPRAKAKSLHQGTIGWRLENMWPLAWILGFEPRPPASGEMIDGKTIRAMLFDFEPKKDKVRSEADVLDLEDLFYCAHNAGRSAQLGGKTVPKGFDPIAGTGVIHERRHALTWATSPRVKWDDTDLST
jgi:hypothetical protein